MQNTVYISNLPYSATDADLKNYFGTFGAIKHIKMLTDKETGRPRGIAFVEYLDETTAASAIEGSDNRDFMGRSLKVSLARPKGQRPERPVVREEVREVRAREYQEYPQPEMSWHDPSFNQQDRRDRRDRKDRRDRRKHDRYDR